MENNTLNIPTEKIDLPSKGLVYPKESPLSSGVIEMKYMTAREEDILTNKNFLKKGIMFDELLKALIVSDIDQSELIEGDRAAILVAARILAYGKDYVYVQNGEEKTVDLTTLEEKEIDHEYLEGKNNNFEFTLPKSKANITFKLLTHGDEKKIDQEVEGMKKINKNFSAESSTRLKHMITSVNGSADPNDIRSFIDKEMLAMDARAFRKHYNDISPDINMTTTIENEDGEEEVVNVPMGIQFFWPDFGI